MHTLTHTLCIAKHAHYKIIVCFIELESKLTPVVMMAIAQHYNAVHFHKAIQYWI